MYRELDGWCDCVELSEIRLKLECDGTVLGTAGR